MAPNLLVQWVHLNSQFVPTYSRGFSGQEYPKNTLPHPKVASIWGFVAIIFSIQGENTLKFPAPPVLHRQFWARSEPLLIM